MSKGAKNDETKARAAVKPVAETPLMKQYNAIKAVHGDAILLFRIGDFYETFGSDAIKASSILGITLTRRANGAAAYIELAGFPHHSIDTYLPKLVRAGERVAVCDQLEDPKTVKGIVKRGVTELITPGIAMSDSILSPKGNTFLASVYFGAKKTGVAFTDISTGEFYTAEGTDEYVDKLMSNFAPKEVIYQRGYEDRFQTAFGSQYYTYKLDEWVFSEQVSREKLENHFQTTSLKGFGIEDMNTAVVAAGAVLYYLEFTEHKNIKHLTAISKVDEDRYVWIDKFTIRNLELFSSNSLRYGDGFVGVIDRTQTPMGGRLLRRWIALPIKDIDVLERRLDVVEYFIENNEFEEDIAEEIAAVGDLERICSRIATRRVVPRELVQLKNSLHSVARIKDLTAGAKIDRLKQLSKALNRLEEVSQRIEREVYPDPSNQIVKGGVIATGVDMELDDLRRVSMHGKDLIAEIQERESEKTGIPSLKIGFNNVFGYYIEVRNTHKDKVPERWTRKQTLTSAERYITEELKEYEEKVLGAQEKILEIEQRIYERIIDYLAGFIVDIQRDAAVIAELDCLRSFAEVARNNNYCRPRLNEGKVLDIRQGRHPMIERLLPVGEAYVPNDVYLDDRKQQIIMITGPNMSGKSALLRQTALIVLMAQIGCYVPAAEANIGVVDKIFTRVGASDNISEGESTFMVEMLESANILNNLSDRSLILLDEIGRGTSTYDGMSIAWAMAEYIHNHPTYHAKTLFATHYHELNEMEQVCERIKNFNVSVREIDRKVVFLRKLVPGGTEHSFGIHVAKMAGMPRWVVERAEQKLAAMEATRRAKAEPEQSTNRNAKKTNNEFQLTMFQLDDPVLIQIRDQIKGLNINLLTPLEALNKLHEIKKISGI